MYVWNQDGIAVSNVVSSVFKSTVLYVTGTARYVNQSIQWSAVITSQGWNVDIIKSTGRIGEYQGATFNLPLEVAAAIKRLC